MGENSLAWHHGVVGRRVSIHTILEAPVVRRYGAFEWLSQLALTVLLLHLMFLRLLLFLQPVLSYQISL